MPDETTILRFRHLLGKRQLASQVLVAISTDLAQQGLILKIGTIADATIIAAPSSTKTNEGERDPEMQQTKKGNQWHVGMKAHMGVDASSGLVHTVIGTTANVIDMTQAAKLLRGKEERALGDAGYQGVDKRPDMQGSKAKWHPGKRQALDSARELHKLLEKAERLKASVRAQAEHPFRVIKQQFCATGDLRRARHA